MAKCDRMQEFKGLDLLRVFEYGVTATELSLPGTIGGSYLDGGAAAGGMATAAGMPGGLGGGSSVPWRRPLSGSDGYVSCPQCQKPITSYNLNRHVRMVHSNMEHATCPVCCKEFKNKYSLATHLHRQHAPHTPAAPQPQAVPQAPVQQHHLAAPPTSTC
ncbi:hypothetical protein Pmani_014686 [Petrolisthes manimaculis]|uniref:C2H2-type domain-containing protein n=1 Tax=Petrolisthes manimaculis TaxID=1843537 RepID=A0AAE1PTU1_9EUCA|nr:hypothetical protein Pmani_014686 [Petrolisthes manimaculis]